MIIEKRSLDRQAADWIREAVIVGRLPPGTRMTEGGLAAEIGLSRSTVRTALQRLASEGLVMQRPYSGWEIAMLSVDDAVELYSLRFTLEGMAARLAAEKIDDAGRLELKKAMENLREALRSGSRRSVAEADLDVHKTITALSGHKRLAAHCDILGQSILIYVMSTNHAMPGADVLREHEDMVEAILAKNADKAEALAQAHVRDAQAVIVDNLARQQAQASQSPKHGGVPALLNSA